MKVLVTGGAGFIGSNLVHMLHREHDIHVLDDLSEGNPSNLKGTDHTLIEGDIRQWGNLKIVKDMDLIYHLACKKMVHSIENPLPDLCVNIGGTLKLLEMARKHDVPLIFTSTGSVLGNPDVFPTSEDHPPDPESPYGVSKWAAEEYCKLYHKMYGLNVVIARLFSVYGPRQTLIGVIPKFIKQTLDGEPMTVEGDGMQARTFTYVDDCVEALILLSEKGVPGEVYNIAGEQPYTIYQIKKEIADALGDHGVKLIPRKKGDLDLSYPSTEKIRAIGWNPKTDLPEGIKKTMEWIKNG